MDTSREFFIQRVSLEDVITGKTVAEFNSLFMVRHLGRRTA